MGPSLGVIVQKRMRAGIRNQQLDFQAGQSRACSVRVGAIELGSGAGKQVHWTISVSLRQGQRIGVVRMVTRPRPNFPNVSI